MTLAAEVIQKGPRTVPLNDDWRFYYSGKDSALDFAKNPDSFPTQSATLPHSFNADETHGRHRGGFGWYAREVENPVNGDQQECFLVLEAMPLRGRVFVDGKPVGRNDLAYLPGRFHLTPFLVPGKPFLLTVQIDNRLRRNDFPDKNCNGWWVYGGLTGKAYLQIHEKARLDGVAIRTEYLAPDSFAVKVAFTSRADAPDSVLFELKHPSGPVRIFNIPQDQPAWNSFTLRVGRVQAWHPDHPFLYDVRIVPYFGQSAGEAWSAKRGFTQLKVTGGKLTLNGRPIFLRGIGRHDVLGLRGAGLSREERLRDLVDLKKLHANFLRIAHHPQVEDIYSLCDSLGLLVMDEIPAWKSDAAFLGSSHGKQLAKTYLDTLVREHGNHTSLVAWSLGNEFNTLKVSAADYVRDVSIHLRAIDPTRPVTYCTYFYQFDKGLRYCDFISVNEYFGWFLGSLPMLTPMLKAIQKDYPDKPIVVTEFGANAGAGIRNPQPALAGFFKSPLRKDLSEDHQALFLGAHLDTLWSQYPLAQGAVVWCYRDFLEPRRPPRKDSMTTGVNGMGLLNAEGKRKLAYDEVKDRYGKIWKAEL